MGRIALWCVLLIGLLSLGSSAWAQEVKTYAEAEQLLRAGKVDEALATFKQVAEQAENDEQKARALAAAVDCELRLGHFDQAMTVAESIPGAGLSVNAQARVLVANKASAARFQKVLDLYAGQEVDAWPQNEAAAAHKQIAIAYFQLRHGKSGDELSSLGKLANEHFQKALELKPDAREKTSLLLQQAENYRLVLQDTDQAVQTYEQAYASTTNIARQTDAVIGIAVIHIDQGHPQLALTQLDRINLLRLSMTYPRIEWLRTRGLALTRLNRNDEAIDCYRKALEHPGILASQKEACEAAIAALTASK